MTQSSQSVEPPQKPVWFRELLLSPVVPALEALERLTSTDGAQEYACLSARREHGVRSANVKGPVLLLLLRGRKSVQMTAQEHALVPGDMLVFTRSCAVDAFNWPDQEGHYLSLMLPLCTEVLSAARILWGNPVGVPGPAAITLPMQALEEPLQAWAEAVHAQQLNRARLALTSLVLSLCELGHSAVLRPTAPTLTDLIRERVARAPHRNWRSTDFELELGLSAATLRRRLAAEGRPLRELIAETRLACALELLYTTHWPVKTVAARVGYHSVSSFTRRFTERYGLAPGQIGNADA